MSYQAIPAAWGLVELRHAGELLAHVPGWFRHGRLLRPWPEADALLRQIRELDPQRSGLEARNCFLDRRWDVLHYLLSAKRRGETASYEDELLDAAVLGAREIGENVLASQGVPVKYVNPEEVELIAVLLEAMTAESLRLHYSPEKMASHSIYKFYADQADAFWPWIAEDFVRFRSFYLDTARHHEGVIVCLH